MADNNGESSRITAIRKQLKASAQNNAEKCEYCFLFDKFCDQTKPTCSSCADRNRTCKPQKVAPKHNVQLHNTQDPWKKCQACKNSNAKCVYTGTSLRCTHCEEKKIRCIEQILPVWRTVRRSNAQPKEQKCRACFETKSVCDQEKPSCGYCTKYKYHCVPRGTPRIKPVHMDDKCKRCRQLKTACSHTLPCERCQAHGIKCGPSTNEEAFAREGEAEEARAREIELEASGDGEVIDDEAENGETVDEDTMIVKKNGRYAARTSVDGRAPQPGAFDAPVGLDNDRDNELSWVAKLGQDRKRKMSEGRRRRDTAETRRRLDTIIPKFTAQSRVEEESASEYDPGSECED